MEAWYKVVTPRPEVREGRSFNPDEFAIALEQVVAGTAPVDYRDPAKFFSRTVFTRALSEHLGMVLRRLSGKTEDTASVMTLITQFGGGKTHTLTALYHLAKNPQIAQKDPGVQKILFTNGLTRLPETRVAVLVGNAWDPKEGRETPWIDVARQLAGDEGVAALGPKAKTSPPGTEALTDLFRLAGGRVVVLFDEVLNLVNRHRDLADPFHAFIQNLTVAMTGTTECVAIISLPRSQVEMGDFDRAWQEKITKVVKRVSKDLIANDESEIAEVVRRRLFEDFDDKAKKKFRAAAQEYADWCFERRAQLPPEWTAVETAGTDVKAREHLRARFEACYPIHPATLSVFQRKWQTLPQYQQTRGTLAMLAQWVSHVYREGYENARNEAFISIGSAPLKNQGFRATVLGQLGESRLIHAIDADIAGDLSHARALDADAKGNLKDIHRRVATAIFFESSGGMTGEKAAHLPELRFALGEPGMDTTSIDTAAQQLENRAFYLRKVGRDGYRFGTKPTLRMVVGNRRASLDEPEVKKAEREATKREFEKDATVKFALFPQDSSEVADAPRLTLVVMDPETAYAESRRKQLASWTRERTANNPRLYPAALVWCLRKPGSDLREKVEIALAWKRVQDEINRGILGGDFDAEERREVERNVRDANDQVREEIWAAYRYVAVFDPRETDGLRVIDLGAGHSSAGESLAQRVLAALRSEGRLSESVGAGYLERNWPAALRDSGAWPLAGVRKAFLDGSLTRLPDPEAALRAAIPRLVERGEFGLASGQRTDKTFGRVWFKQIVPSEEILFDAGTFLLTKGAAQTQMTPSTPPPPGTPTGEAPPTMRTTMPASPVPEVHIAAPGTPAADAVAAFRLAGSIAPEAWNKLGIRLIPALKKGQGLTVSVSVAVQTSVSERENFERELRRALAELGLGHWQVEIKEEETRPS
jgi:uncharacterized protein DUF499